MFEAFRSKLIGAWRDLRARGMVSLFFFELVVVTLGVLIAQGLAEWASHRRDIASLRAAQDRSEFEIIEAMDAADAYQRIVPCIDDRMSEIGGRLGRGEDIDPRLYDRPAFAYATVTPFSPEQIDLLRDIEGDIRTQLYGAISFHAATLELRREELRDAWEGLSVLDPDYGVPSEAARYEALRSASKVRALLRGVKLSAGNLVEDGRTLGLEPSTESGRFFQDCDELWETGQMFFYHDGREQ